MKEITTSPVKVQNGEDGIEMYESKGGFCMTTEFLGQCVGYAHPKVKMAQLFKRHKEALEPHRFIINKDDKPMGNKLPSKVTYSPIGQPSFFYDEEGILKVFLLAGTPQAKEFGPKIIDHLKHLNALRIQQIEKYWFKHRPYWPEIRDRVMMGQTFREIADAVGRSAASIRNAVRRMIEVGILQPARALQSVTGSTKKTLIRYTRKFMGDDRQLSLPNFGPIKIP